jgi:hypothetical protein
MRGDPTMTGRCEERRRAPAVEVIRPPIEDEFWAALDRLVDGVTADDVDDELRLFGVGQYQAPGSRRPGDPCLCAVCGVDTLRAGTDWYMVTPEAWRDAGLLPREFACLTCLAERLGRPLAPLDFPDLPINRWRGGS